MRAFLKRAKDLRPKMSDIDVEVSLLVGQFGREKAYTPKINPQVAEA